MIDYRLNYNIKNNQMKMGFRSTNIRRPFSFLSLKVLVSILLIANAMEESSVDEFSQRRELGHLTPD